MKRSFHKLTALLSLSLAIAGFSNAAEFTLTSADAVARSGFTPSWGQSEWLFSFDGVAGGEQAANYSVTSSGTGAIDDPHTWTVTFDYHPQLTYALMHVGGGLNYLEWAPSSVFDDFNNSTALSIAFVQDFYKNSQRTAYLGISGIGLDGTAGDEGGGDEDDGGGGGLLVPDSSTTITLLGLALLGIVAYQRKFRS